MTARIIKAESLAGVHTKKISLVKINNKIYSEKGNIGLSGKYYDTG